MQTLASPAATFSMRKKISRSFGERPTIPWKFATVGVRTDWLVIRVSSPTITRMERQYDTFRWASARESSVTRAWELPFCLNPSVAVATGGPDHRMSIDSSSLASGWPEQSESQHQPGGSEHRGREEGLREGGDEEPRRRAASGRVARLAPREEPGREHG